jgi:hypothetical protein
MVTLADTGLHKKKILKIERDILTRATVIHFN